MVGNVPSVSVLHPEALVGWVVQVLASGEWLTRFTKSGSTVFPSVFFFFFDCRQPRDVSMFFGRCRAIFCTLLLHNAKGVAFVNVGGEHNSPKYYFSSCVIIINHRTHVIITLV